MWDVIVLIPDHCLSIYFEICSNYIKKFYVCKEREREFIYQPDRCKCNFDPGKTTALGPSYGRHMTYYH